MILPKKMATKMVYVPPRAAFLVLSAIICHLAKKISYLCTVKTNQRALAVFFDILIIKATSDERILRLSES